MLFFPFAFGLISNLLFEAERLQDFPDDWTKYKLNSKGEVVEVSDRMRMFFMGNALVTGIVTRIAEGIKSIDCSI